MLLIFEVFMIINLSIPLIYYSAAITCSLNGIEVDENRWLAQPAPVFPVEILRALWSRPEERGHVSCVIYRLLRELEEPISATELSRLTNLATRYFCGKEI